MEDRWTIEECPFCRSKAYQRVDEDGTPTYRPMPVVPCDEQAVERVAAELCRQRGWKWAEQGNHMRVAFTNVAILALRAAAGEAP